MKKRKTSPLQQLAGSAKAVLQNVLVALENQTGAPADQIVILDDCFPNLVSSFRIAEFNALMERFPQAQVHSSCKATGAAHGKTLEAALDEYARAYPSLAQRVQAFHPRRKLRGSVGYMVFLSNVLRYLGALERDGLPFVFTLYPGGGFRLDDPQSNHKLKATFASPQFRKVIVTQSITRDYLLAQHLCPAEQIEFIFGGVVPSNFYTAAVKTKKRYGVDKQTLDICFVANKYMPQGRDKGYDLFIETARILAAKYKQARFHVVGSFTPEDFDVSALKERITFHGTLHTSALAPFFAGMDVILSPNAPFISAPGAFDGFPTGCCMEAGLCGVAVFCTDELRQNEGRWRNGEEIVLITRQVQEICDSVETYIADPNRLALLGENGRKAFCRILDLEKQMEPRARIIRQLATLDPAPELKSRAA